MGFLHGFSKRVAREKTRPAQPATQVLVRREPVRTSEMVEKNRMSSLLQQSARSTDLLVQYRLTPPPPTLPKHREHKLLAEPKG